MQKAVLISMCLLTVLGVLNGISSAECPSYWTHFRGSCYRFFGTRKMWIDAELHCNQFSSNAHSDEEAISHLVSINSEAENDFIYGMWVSTRETPADDPLMWLGFYKPVGRNYFTWSDHSDIDFTYWDSQRPNNAGGTEDCVEMWEQVFATHRLKSWNDRPCANEASYICEMQYEWTEMPLCFLQCKILR